MKSKIESYPPGHHHAPAMHSLARMHILWQRMGGCLHYGAAGRAGGRRLTEPSELSGTGIVTGVEHSFKKELAVSG